MYSKAGLQYFQLKGEKYIPVYLKEQTNSQMLLISIHIF